MVVLNYAPVDLTIRVLRDGKLLVDRDRSKRIHFEVKTRFEFRDLEPYLKMYRRMGEEAEVTDYQLVAKKLALIEASVGELRTLVHLEAIPDDLRELRFAAYTLHIAIQAALDVAAHIVSDDRLGEAHNNREFFELLARYGWYLP